MFKVIIAGTKHYNDVFNIERWCDYYLQNQHPVQIIQTTEEGFDKRVEVWRKKHNYNYKEFEVDWRPKGAYDKKSKRRTHMEMILEADALIAFDFGGSDIKHLIDVAKDRGLKVKVISQEKQTTPKQGGVSL